MGQAYVDELGQGNTYLHLGTYDVNIDEPDTIAPVLVTRDRLGRDRLGYVHLAPYRRAMPEQSQISPSDQTAERLSTYCKGV